MPKMFDIYRRNLEAEGLTTSRADSLICPLCWKETEYEELSNEHIVPEKVGGRQLTLTCRGCNNQHGSGLDAHVTQYQNFQDGMRGVAPIRGRLEIEGNCAAGNVQWGDGRKHFEFVPEASNPVDVEALWRLSSPENIDELTLVLHHGYNETRFQVGILRCAYLALFAYAGYGYVKHEAVQQVRRKIADPFLSHPKVNSLVYGLSDFSCPRDNSHHIVPGKINGVEFVLVIVRLRKKTTTYHAVFMPSMRQEYEDFSETMERCAGDIQGMSFNIPLNALL